MKIYSKILCFDETSMVTTTIGDTLIKEITPGVEVLSYDEEKGTLIVDIVTSVAKSQHSRCAIIDFENGIYLKSTVDHPLFVQNKGWCSVETSGIKEMYGVGVEQLNVGDSCVFFKDKRYLSTKVKSISIQACSEMFYCLSTKTKHNFLVNGIVAHDVDINRFSLDTLRKEGVEVM